MTKDSGGGTGGGVVAAVLTLFGVLTALVATAGAINVLAGGHGRLRVSGAAVDLPRHWESVVPLYVVAGGTLLLGWLVGNFSRLRAAIGRHPLRIALVALATTAALVVTYLHWGRYALAGGKLSWAIQHDRLDVCREALAADPPAPALLEAAHRAASARRVAMLRLVLARELPIDRDPRHPKRCLVSACVGAGLEAVRLCVAKGSKVASCYEGSRILGRMIEHRAHFGYSDAELLAGARLLVQAGADPFWDSPQDDSAFLMARREKLADLVAYFESLPRPARRRTP